MYARARFTMRESSGKSTKKERDAQQEKGTAPVCCGTLMQLAVRRGTAQHAEENRWAEKHPERNKRSLIK